MKKQTEMEKEILEQSQKLGDLVSKYVQNYVVTFDMPLIVRDIKIVASGSSYNCAQISKKFFEKIADVPTSVEFSGEFLCDLSKQIDTNSLYFFISQSGETFDTLNAANLAKEKGAKTVAIVNNDNSTLYNLCDYKMNINTGVENSIAATKSFSASILALYLCAVKIGQNKLKDVASYLKNINELAQNIASLPENIKNIDKAADFLSKRKNFPVVGQGINYEIAREAALKIRETSYIDVNAYSMGEFVHGHVAVLNKIDTLIEILSGDISEFELKNFNRIKDSYKPKSVVITDNKENLDAKIFVEFPRFEDEISTTLAKVFIIQLLALKIALKLKRNVDSPQGLSKIVQ